MRYQRVIPLLLLLALLSGCGKEEENSGVSSEPPSSSASASDSSSEPESSVSEAEPDAPTAELSTPGQLIIYESKPGSDIFEAQETTVPENATLLDLVKAVEQHLGAAIPVRSITQQKGMVVIDLEKRFIEDHSKAEVQRILTTLAATLRENHRSFEWIQYRLGGETGVFSEQFEIPPIKLLEGEAAEFTAIRAGIPYEGLYYHPLETHILETDDTGKRLAEYLSVLALYNGPVASLTEVKNERILYTAVSATKHYSTNPDDEGYKPELKPFDAPAEELLGMREDWYWLREHVEESIRLLYGDIPYTHEDFSSFRYLETLGVYTPPHMGGGGRTHPAIFGYEDTGDHIVAEVAYVQEGMGGYLNPGEDWEEIPADELEDYVRTKSTRYLVTVKKLPDNWFLLESQVLKE